MCPTYIIIAFDNFSPNKQNPLFRDCTVECSIFCHPDHWLLPDFQVRPFKIAGEIDSMLNENKFSGIGTLQFQNGTQLTMNRNMLGFALQYKAIHGIDDKIEG